MDADGQTTADGQQFPVPDDFHCPLCPDHQDDRDEFFWSDLLNSPICLGCTYDTHYALTDHGGRPGHDHPAGKVVELMERHSGQNFEQLRFRYLWQKIERETGTAPMFPQYLWHKSSTSELKSVNLRLLADLGGA